jgi:predicted permease
MLLILDDFRRALTRLRSNAGTLTLSVLMLALAIGVTAAMFTVLDALMLHPVPFRDAGRLTAVVITTGRGAYPTVPPAALQAMQASGAFDGVEGALQSPVVLETGGEMVSRAGARITPGMLELLGVRPVLGRTFADGEGRAGTSDRILISEDLWQTLFNRDPGIIGRRIRISGTATEVIGVLPAGFRFPYSRTVVWRPVDFDAPPPDLTRARPMAYARFAAGIPAADAQRTADQAVRAVTPLEAGQQVGFRPIAAGMVDKYSRQAVRALSVGVGLVFLVLCANAMNLMLTRFSARQREFGVCSALGATRARLLREALFETAIVGLVAAGLGLLVAKAFVTLATEYLPEAFLTSTLSPVALNWRAVAATTLLGIVAAAIAGITPAWMATKVDAAESLRLSARGGTEVRTRRRLARGLLVAELALSTTLLAGAALLVRTFVNLTHADRGLNAEGVITGWVALPEFAFTDRPGRLAFAAALEDRLGRLPGVRLVSLSGGVPPASGAIYFGKVRSDAPDAADIDVEINAYSVGARFFELFGIRLLSGRTFLPAEAADEVIIGERFARMLWPDGQAVGRSFSLDGQKPYRVVGVVAEIRNPSLDPRLDRPEVYHPLVVERDGRVEASAFGRGQIFLALRCDAGCPGLDAIRQAIRSVSAQVEIAYLGPMEEAYLKDLARPRAAAALAAMFASVALVASAGGLFGILTAAVARRRREFGIRVALGIEPGRLRRLVLADALGLAAMGLAAGVFGAWMLGRGLASLTYGVSASDPRSWALVCGALGLSTIAAAWRPATQATRVNPAVLLREE